MTTEQTPPPEGTEEPQEPEQGTQAPEDAQEPEDTTEPELFPREYVVKLRQEAADARVKAKRADELAQRLHGALVTATGRLADPTDLPYDEAHLGDDTALDAAIDDLLARKPHLASRRVVGDVGQGATGSDTTVDLAGMLRGLAS